MIYYVNNNQKRAGVAILSSDTININKNIVTREHSIIKGSIHQKLFINYKHIYL